MIAVRNAMFAEDQSDVQEFFLYVIEEIAKEIDSFSSSSCSAPSSEEDQMWNEIGSGGRKLIIQEAIVKQNIINSLFEIQMRKQCRSYSKRQFIEQQSYLTLSLPISTKSVRKGSGLKSRSTP